MIKTLTNLFKQDKEKFVVPKGVQDVIPVAAIFDDGIFKVGKDKYSKTYRFTDINYAVASREDKEAMFLEYSELLNSLDSGATTKITINNRRLNRLDFEQTILIPTTGDNLDEYREEYNKMLLDKATGANSIVQDKYITISINKKSVEDARTYFARVGADLIAHFGRLGSKCVELETDERLRIFHDFYRVGEESSFHFDIKETRKKGHDFKDYICPDTMEFEKDYFKMGNRYGRVLFLREYASYIKDSMVAELTDMNRNLMMSIDIVPVPTDEAVKEAENRLLGVETNITNWQRRQNANNNFSATVPYDMEQQKKEMKEFLDDLTTRDQRMMFAVITMVITADSKEQLENDTEGLITAYANKFSNRVIQSIDIEHFITEFLMLRIEYASFAEDDAGRIGFLADGATPLLVHQDGKIIPFVFPKDTIVLDKFLLAEKEQGRRRFTMAHEASHHILSKMYAMPSEGRFHAEYDSERSYSKEELAQMFASVEWQADTMGASLLMPRRIIENALAKYNQSNPIRVYGDNTITSKDKAVIRRMAAYIGVSYTALVIRLRDMGLFEYHNILEYISNELNLGGVSQ